MSETIIKLPFHELCKIKREKMNLAQSQVIQATKYKNYSLFERGINTPQKQKKEALMKFFKITEDEIAKFVNTPIKLPTKARKITMLVREIDSLIDSVNDLQLSGKLGKTVKDSCLTDLEIAREAIAGLDLLDRLI